MTYLNDTCYLISIFCLKINVQYILAYNKSTNFGQVFAVKVGESTYMLCGPVSLHMGRFLTDRWTGGGGACGLLMVA